MSEIAPTHHAVTSDDVGPTDTTTQALPHTSSHTTGQSQWQKSNYDSNTRPSNEGYSNFDNIARGGATDPTSSSEPRRSSVVNGVEADYETARRASLQNLEERRKSSLSSTPGPFNASTTDDVSKHGVPPSSSVGSQNAPTKSGERAESIVGGMGFGGAQVERPKEEQGIAEKIVNLMGG